MNPCEKILAGMNPAIRAYHTGRWLTRETQPGTAEDLYREWKKRYETEINLLADRIF